MELDSRPAAGLVSIRPLVRYVDEHQAVIDLHLTVQPSASGAVPTDRPVMVTVQMHSPDPAESEFVLERRARVTLTGGTGLVRFDLADPHRWWPAGMGAQMLYELTVALAVDDAVLETCSTPLGLTSVRALAAEPPHQPRFVVNGKECAIQKVVPIDPADEGHVLPVGGRSLLVVRDHFGPDELYEAADRAGILLVQGVPAQRHRTLATQVDRLVAHPSLAGWLLDHLGRMAEGVHQALRVLDPTRPVFRHWPGL